EDNFPGNGGELARHLLDRFDLHQVQVEKAESVDHYDPGDKAVRLSKDKLDGKTLTAITTAAHEVGHALQDAAQEPLFRWRTRLGSIAVGAQRLGSFLLFVAPILSIVTRAPAAGLLSAMAAFLVMGSNVVLQLATLPVELDASFKKALPLLKNGYLRTEQYRGAEKILRAAAFTYLSASLAGLLNFWQWMRVLKR
ncbi:MAG: zinc metallopeptidase, partial [Candidatus Thiodiazotropha sp.]